MLDDTGANLLTWSTYVCTTGIVATSGCYSRTFGLLFASSTSVEITCMNYHGGEGTTEKKKRKKKKKKRVCL